MKDQTVILGKNLEISPIITGLWQIADMEREGTPLDPVKTAQYMVPYVEAGLTTFDMADHYGSSEIITGTFKNNHALGKQVQLFTKWVPEPGPIGLENVREAVQRALGRMQQPYIDLMQFHAWNYPDPSWLDGLFHLDTLRKEGLIKHLGVTNFDAAHLRMACASGIPIVSNQICHSLIDRRAMGQMDAVCKEYDVKLLAFGTLAGGFLTEKWLGQAAPRMEDLKTWSQMKYKRFIDVAGSWEDFQKLLRTVAAIAKTKGVSMANVATRYILNNPHVAAVIIGARLGESKHVDDNRHILDMEWTPADTEVLDRVVESLEPIPGNCGDEYRKPPFLTASGDLSHHLSKIPKPFMVQKDNMGRERIYSGTPWEPLAGYCRAVKVENRIEISGTTATHGDKLIGGNDAAAQTHFVIDKIAAVLQSFGGGLEHVVRTRIFVHNLEDWEAVARAHGERFKGIDPSNTLVAAQLVGEGYLVEIEAVAYLKA